MDNFTKFFNRCGNVTSNHGCDYSLIIEFIKKIYSIAHYDLPAGSYLESDNDTNIHFKKARTYALQTFMAGEIRINKNKYIEKTIKMLVNLSDDEDRYYPDSNDGLLGYRASFVANTNVFNTYISKSKALLLFVQDDVVLTGFIRWLIKSFHQAM